MTVHGLNVLDPLVDWPVMARHVRLWDCGVTWKDLNPEPGVFVWDRLDAILAKGHPGTRYTLVLGMTPAWAAKNPQAHSAPWLGPGTSSRPDDLESWAQYVRAVAARYKDRINAYQVWNEPQLKEFWSDWDRVDVLAHMTAVAKRILDRVDPGALVVSAPVLPRRSSGGMTRGSRYLAAMREASWPVDVYAAHIYPEPGKGPAAWAEMAQEWKSALARQGAPRRLLWVTETNYNLFGGPLPVDIQSARVKITDEWATQLRISRVFWYAWGKHSDPRLMGIPMYPGTHGASLIARYL